MEKEILPDKLTKKMLFELYRPIPKRIIRSHINSFIEEIGGNVRVKIIPSWAILNFFLLHGIPSNYKLSGSLQSKYNKLEKMREKMLI